MRLNILGFSVLIANVRASPYKWLRSCPKAAYFVPSGGIDDEQRRRSSRGHLSRQSVDPLSSARAIRTWRVVGDARTCPNVELSLSQWHALMSSPKTRIPKWRAVSPSAAKSEKEAVNERKKIVWPPVTTSMKHSSKPSDRRAAAEVTVERSARRQWNSFDLGSSPPPESLLRDMEKTPVVHSWTLEDKAASKQLLGSGSRHLMKLKEELAANGTSESLKKMADDLLQG